MSEPRHIVRTAGIDWAKAWRGRHPFNQASEMRIARLSDAAGMQRLGVHLIRIPPGKESFIPHSHAVAVPSIGKTVVFRERRMTLFGDDGTEELSETEWMARARLD